MKKVISILLCVVMLVTLVSCVSYTKKPKKAATFDISSLKTISNVMKLETERGMSSYNKTQYGCLFQYGGVYYRVYADLPEGVFDQLEAIDIFDEKREEKMNAILKDLKITVAEDMTPYIPTEEELDQYIGKTGEELLNGDFWAFGHWVDDDLHIYMGNGFYECDVCFDGTVEVTDDYFDMEEIIKTMTVKKIIFTGFLNDALNLYIEDDEDSLGVNGWETLGDIFDLDKEDKGILTNDSQYIALFCYDGVYYRVYADITPEIYDALCEIDFFDEERDAKMNAILADIAITLAEDMTQYIPTEDDLAQYVGKTGAELLDEGFTSCGYSLDGEQVFWMENAICQFEISFNERVEFDENDMEDFDAEEAIKPLTVKEMVFTEFSSRVIDPE